jgi:hypothetical protein
MGYAANAIWEYSNKQMVRMEGAENDTPRRRTNLRNREGDYKAALIIGVVG